MTKARSDRIRSSEPLRRSRATDSDCVNAIPPTSFSLGSFPPQIYFRCVSRGHSDAARTRVPIGAGILHRDRGPRRACTVGPLFFCH